MKKGAQTGEIVHAAADAVEFIDCDPVDLPCTDIREQALEGGAVGVFAGKAAIGIDAAGVQFGDRQASPAALDLGVDRDAVRPVNRLAGVDRSQLAPSPFGYTAMPPKARP